MPSSLGIDGLSSGLDTTAIINQLMSIERQPIVRMQQRISRNDAAISSLQKFSSAMDNIESLAKKLTGDKATFIPAVATSSLDSVVATAEAGAPTGSFTFTVDTLAASHRLVSGGTTAALSDQVATADSTVRITVDGVDHDIATGDGSLSTLISNINAATDLGVSAQAINTGSGFKLQLASRTSGAAGTFTVDTTNMTSQFASGTATAGQPMPVLTQGRDASITLGDGPGAFTVTSSTNTFTDVIDGVTFTVTEADPATPVTISVEPDADALVDTVRSFVDAVNGLLGDLDTSLDSGKDGTQGSLSNDPSMRSLRTQLLNAVTFAVGGSSLGSAGLVGIESTREGRLEFDESRFRDALSADPDALIGIFRSDDAGTPGIAQRVFDLAETATTLNTGTFATAVQSRESRNDALQDQIDRLDIRLELRRAGLQRQFSALEVALSGMNSQSEWLAQQISSMNAQKA